MTPLKMPFAPGIGSPSIAFSVRSSARYKADFAVLLASPLSFMFSHQVGGYDRARFERLLRSMKVLTGQSGCPYTEVQRILEYPRV